MRKIKEIIGKSIFYKKIKFLIIRLMYIFPIQNKKVVFDNFGGRGFGDDPKYIAEELINRRCDLKLIWVATDVNIEVPKEIKVVKYGTIRAAYHWVTAKIWVDNIKSSLKPKKRKGQFYIQTWHSTLGFKKNEQDAKNLPIKYIKQAKGDARVTDLMYSNNDFRYEKYKNCFWYSGNVIKCDVPRIGALMNPKEETKEKVRKNLSIDKSCKIVLYAPTFRKDTDIDVYKFNYIKCLKRLEKRFGDKFIFLIRLHPNEARYINKLECSKNIIDATAYPDMQELLAVADVLITDYSGCMFDFGFTRKPVFLFAKDLKRYLAKERETYFSLSDVPFKLAQDEYELMKNIEEFNLTNYKIECQEFENRIGFKDFGHGAEYIGEIILEKMLGD